ncbi:soluble guanylate cyclase 88E-like isoform X1 [Branchiostoma floridae x Branchiostoma belcheri]
MYGMLVESVQHYVRKVYGEEKWLQILELSGFKNTVFATQRVYKDDVLPRIAENCSAVVMDKSTEDFLLFFGTCFVNFWSHYGYDRVVRVSGRHFRDFVHGIDNIHEMMRFSYPKMKSPSFYCEEESHEGLTLHYQSCRTGYSNYVCGQMSQVAKNFYNLDLNMVKLKDFQEGRGYHVVFRLYFDNSAFIPPKIKCIRSLSVEEQVPALRFLKLFPFCVVFQRNMKFVYVGEKVRELFGEDEFLTAEKVTDIFYIRRPPMDFTWENVLRLQQVVFELVSVECVRSPTQNGLLPAARHLHLRGQMRYMPDWDCVIFLCSPLIQNTNEMLELGLYINDLSMHDNSRELVMAGTQHMASLEVSYERSKQPEVSFLQLLSYRRCLQKSYDKAVKYSEQLCENMKKCEDWRKHSDELLYQMIPRTVADRLRRGMDVNDTVEAFPEVTVMFSYLVGFMEISAKVPAVQLVTTINDFFTLFDTISLRHDVFKFETLGDAVYMVVGGAPERNPRHAHCVAALALELNREVERLKNPIDGAKLKVKIGMHSGPVVAGVISLKMPQYCMVGDTVNTASRMGTNSEPGKITLSESVNKLLYGGEFITAYRGTLLVKGKGRMKTYWLVGARVARPCSPPSLLKPRSWKDLQRGMSIEFDCMHEVEKEMLQNSPLQDIAESQESLTVS